MRLQRKRKVKRTLCLLAQCCTHHGCPSIKWLANWDIIEGYSIASQSSPLASTLCGFNKWLALRASHSRSARLTESVQRAPPPLWYEIHRLAWQPREDLDQDHERSYRFRCGSNCCWHSDRRLPPPVVMLVELGVGVKHSFASFSKEQGRNELIVTIQMPDIWIVGWL